MLWSFARLWAVAFALAVVVVETRVLLRRQKYWPLAADDYAIAALLVGAAALGSPVALAVGWSVALGSLYATLFSRLDPAYGGTKKWRLLVVAMLVGGVGLASSLGSIGG